MLTWALFQIISVQSQNSSFHLQGVIEVNYNKDSKIILVGIPSYDFFLGDSVFVELSGTANIAPWDEQKKGGGFLGLFKKRYTVRHDDWKSPNDIVFFITLKKSDADNFIVANNQQGGSFGTMLKLPNERDEYETDNFKKKYSLFAFINMRKTPLSAGQINISLTIDSKRRLQILEQVLKRNFKNRFITFKEISELLEMGNILNQYPEQVVKITDEVLRNNESYVGSVKKELMKYFLEKVPQNAYIRNQLAFEHLKDADFSEAEKNAKKTIEKFQNTSEDDLLQDDLNRLAEAYYIIGTCIAIKEMGTQFNAYTLASGYYYKSSDFYRRSGNTKEQYNALSLYTQCLQKVSSVEALTNSVKALNEAISNFQPSNGR